MKDRVSTVVAVATHTFAVIATPAKWLPLTSLCRPLPAWLTREEEHTRDTGNMSRHTRMDWPPPRPGHRAGSWSHGQFLASRSPLDTLLLPPRVSRG
jgi:hypothetical protein